jgi:hypothetical protein
VRVAALTHAGRLSVRSVVFANPRPTRAPCGDSELLRLAGLPDAALMASEAPAVLRELANALHKVRGGCRGLALTSR